MNEDEMRKKISEVNWYHSFDFSNGMSTRGSANTKAKLELIGMPEDLSRKTVLDIGAWDGYYSFEAERRGAKKVLATDSLVWDGVESYGKIANKEGFNLAKNIQI